VLAAAACRPSGAFTVDARPGDLVIVALADQNGALLSAHVLEGDGEATVVEPKERAFAFVLHAADLGDPAGGPLSDGLLRDASARLASQPRGANGACGRCLGPTAPSPWPVYAGESCPVPDAAEVQLWPDDALRDRALEARAMIAIDWPGDCGWPLPDLPARCTPAPAGVLSVGRDCRPNFGATDAWPKRGPEGPPLSLSELLEGCAIFAGCGWLPGGDLVISDCGSIPNRSEESAVPLASVGSANLANPDDARWSWFIRRAIQERGKCSQIASLLVPLPPATACGPDGCAWDGPSAAITCLSGTMAQIQSGGVTTVRDCSRAFARCDVGSLTGCTDRPQRPCVRDGELPWERCDGDVKIGCSTAGLVSFEDCSRVAGARCVETATSAHCDDHRGVECDDSSVPTCEGAVLKACVLGHSTAIDCQTDLGFVGCSSGLCTGG
jgi:hypothetical protein